MTEKEKKLVGIAGLYDDADSLVAAARKVRDEGYKHWDCHTPYPVHGLDQAMGIKASPIPYITITAGFFGVIAALLMQGWMSAVDYPVRIGGKPMFSWPAFVPICFELFVLFAALATMGSILYFCKLVRWNSPLNDSGIMQEVTTHRFGVVIEARDPMFSEARAWELLADAECKDIRPLFEADEEDDSII
ncbi:MAG: DUF3341 domain-containing protein [Planctomycetota bacterium]|jgi:hypothetical protein